MRYIESFQFPSERKRAFPYNIFYPKYLESIDFSHITIFYGSNGSGKSTLLNIIAEKLGVKDKTVGNISPYFSEYVGKCTYQLGYKGYIPRDTLFVRSEDIMQGIANIRKTKTETIREAFSIITGTLEDEFIDLDKLTDAEVENLLEDYRKQSDVSFVQKILYKTGFNELPEEQSNGEISLYFLENVLRADNLIFLDEPENSMSPVFQKRLAELIEKLAYRLDCQFVIASHSPFILSLKDARVYNLDIVPVTTCEWYESENMKAYYRLFKKFEDDFRKHTL